MKNTTKAAITLTSLFALGGCSADIERCTAEDREASLTSPVGEYGRLRLKSNSEGTANDIEVAVWAEFDIEQSRQAVRDFCDKGTIPDIDKLILKP